MLRFQELSGSTALLLAMCGCANAPESDTYSVVPYSQNKCDGLRKGWSPQGSENGELMISNRLIVGKSRLLWNDTQVSVSRAGELASEMAHLNPAANMIIVFDSNTDCATVKDIRQRIAEHLRCGHDIACVEYSYKEWALSHTVPACDAECRSYGERVAGTLVGTR
jgi:hypothetical protein